METNTDEMKALGERIHASMMEIIKHARSQEELDGIYNTLMDGISDDFVIVYLGEPVKLRVKGVV